MLWEQWGWEVPRDPQGRGILWDPHYVAAILAAASAIGAGGGLTRGSQLDELRVLCVHGPSHHQCMGLC